MNWRSTQERIHSREWDCDMSIYGYGPYRHCLKGAGTGILQGRRKALLLINVDPFNDL